MFWSNSLWIVLAGSHVSQRIAPLSETVGFRTVVLDDRPEYASRERFGEPTEIVVLKTFDPLPELPVDEDSYLVIVTRGHLVPRLVAADAAAVYQALLEQGYRKEDLARVCSPIGVAILAETPEEIAVSIVGEMIKARAERELGR